MLALKIKIILPVKTCLFSNIRGIAIWDEQAIAKAIGKSNKVKKKMLFYRENLEGTVLKESLLEKSETSR